MNLLPSLIALAALSAAGPLAAAAETASPVAVVVTVPTPSTLTRTALEKGIEQSVPTYRKVPGLLRKYFTIGDGTFGGVYLFTSRSAAEAWFNEAWVARVRYTYGAPGVVTYFDVPVALDNGPVPQAVVAK